mgnify:CR=1 FL=1
MSDGLRIGDLVIETTPSGRVIERHVRALDVPPFNPAADPGPYVELDGGNQPVRIRAKDILAVDWLEHRPQR